MNSTVDNVLPNKVRFLLADTVREEAGGKLTLMGLYSGDEVLLNGVLPSELPEGKRGFALSSLTYLLVFLDGEGRLPVKIKTYDPGNQPIGPGTMVDLVKRKELAQNLVVPFTSFPIRGFGRYRVVLDVSGKEFEFTFAINPQNASAFPSAPRVPVEMGLPAVGMQLRESDIEAPRVETRVEGKPGLLPLQPAKRLERKAPPPQRRTARVMKKASPAAKKPAPAKARTKPAAKKPPAKKKS